MKHAGRNDDIEGRLVLRDKILDAFVFYIPMRLRIIFGQILDRISYKSILQFDAFIELGPLRQTPGARCGVAGAQVQNRPVFNQRLRQKDLVPAQHERCINSITEGLGPGGPGIVLDEFRLRQKNIFLNG